MKRKLAYLTAVLATAGLAACSAPSTKVMTNTGEIVTLSPEQTLKAYHWNLVNTIKADGSAEPAWVSSTTNQPLMLTFAENRVAIQNLCNTMNAGYALTERDIDFSQVAGTMKMCSDPQLMQYEQQVAKQLPTATDWNLASADQSQTNAPAPILTLHFENGDKWRLEGKPTAETKYGSQAETVFLEIAPQTEVCPQSGNNCLKVRSITYDGNGVQTSAGDWVLFQPNAINGYTHQNGVHQIIRTKRYEIKNAPAGSATEAYEFDMVVATGKAL